MDKGGGWCAASRADMPWLVPLNARCAFITGLKREAVSRGDAGDSWLLVGETEPATEARDDATEFS